MDPHRALNYARAGRKRFVSELTEFLRFPSVSSQPERAGDLRRCAAWLARHLKKIGLDHVRVIPTKGNPIVYASWRRTRDRPTLIFYGHYDVLPGEPLSEWRTPPFVPTLENNALHARGAADDKGQLFSHVKAIESYLKTEGALPVNVICIFEGEEEIGSPNLSYFVERNRRALKAIAAVISDTRMISADQPAISYAQRGGLRAEIEVHGPPQELHSGAFGGAVHNPAMALCSIIAGLHDEEGRVTIPGFYDEVREWSGKERSSMARSGPSDDAILRDAKVEEGWGEPGYSLYERTTIRPDVSVNGILGGHTGHGAKGVIPASALAKISFRLVPDQDPHRIAQLLRDHISRVTPSTVSVTLRTMSSIHPALISRSHSAVQAASHAYRKAFGKPAVFIRSGGSIPVVHTFQNVLGIPAVLMGFGLPDDNIHGPNEKFHLPIFYKAVETCIWYFKLASTLGHSIREPQAKEWSL
ncbi:dipeptidase [Acidicapsa acidisoli]|uniref:dipeptidase n=1 Tax=Acidicapsa acidisoli TaxID=1615681 RepID=UPI0021DFEE9F|nr:dipeptidase [Acidicapsa acidisoli]